MSRSFYIYTQGNLIQKDKTLRFRSIEGDIRDIPINDIDEVYIMNEITITSKILELFSKYGIVVHFFNYYQYYIGSFYPKEQKLAGQLLVKQAEHYSDYSKRLVIAKEFIKSASFNIYRNLRYYNGRGKDVSDFMVSIEALRKEIDNVKSIEELMGIEGNIRKDYYKSWNIIIDQDIDFEKRVYHPADNMINSLISYLNTMVYTKTLSEIYKTQLNPTISYLHQPGVRRFSLSLDISEVFKPLIADRIIFSLLNKKQITQDSFSDGLNGLSLTKKASQIIAKEFDNKMNTTIRHKELNRDVSYQYLIRLEVYKLIKHLIGEKEYKGFEIWW